MRISRNHMYMDIAEVLAKRSTCMRNNVGCVIVYGDNTIISCGYNGPASGEPHCNSKTCLGKKCTRAIHAEANAISRMDSSSTDHSLYVTVSPCIECAKKIVKQGTIKKVFYRYPYRDPSGIVYLINHKVEVVKILSGGLEVEEKI